MPPIGHRFDRPTADLYRSTSGLGSLATARIPQGSPASRAVQARTSNTSIGVENESRGRKPSSRRPPRRSECPSPRRRTRHGRPGRPGSARATAARLERSRPAVLPRVRSRVPPVLGERCHLLLSLGSASNAWRAATERKHRTPDRPRSPSRGSCAAGLCASRRPPRTGRRARRTSARRRPPLRAPRQPPRSCAPRKVST